MKRRLILSVITEQNVLIGSWNLGLHCNLNSCTTTFNTNNGKIWCLRLVLIRFWSKNSKSIRLFDIDMKFHTDWHPYVSLMVIYVCNNNNPLVETIYIHIGLCIPLYGAHVYIQLEVLQFPTCKRSCATNRPLVFNECNPETSPHHS
jgi:hypothetical protein